MSDDFVGSAANSVDNKRGFEAWIATGDGEAAAFAAELCCRELPDWFVADVKARKLAIVLGDRAPPGDAIAVLQAAFPLSALSAAATPEVGDATARWSPPHLMPSDQGADGMPAQTADVVLWTTPLPRGFDKQDLLERLASQAKEYLILALPGRPGSQAAGAPAVDTFPAKLSTGARLLHICQVDAGGPPEAARNGCLLIAIYGRKRNARRRPAHSPAPRRENVLSLDFRHVAPKAIPELLASFAAAQRAKRPTTGGDPLRVLMLVDTWSSGGLENLLVNLSHGLTHSGLCIFIGVVNGPPPAEPVFAAGLPARTVSFEGEKSAFAAFLRQEQIELVNYHHSLFGIDVVQQRGVGAVYTLHSCYLWMDEAARTQVALGLAKMTAVIAVSEQVAQFAQVQFHCPPAKITVVGNGLPGDDIRPAERPPVAQGVPFTVVMVGSFHRLKLQHVAIAAFCQAADDIPELRLRLIGVPLDRIYYAELQEQIAASRHRDRIELIPGLSRAEVIDALAHAHVFLSASAVEGFGLALTEAAAAGCVCICTDVGCARELFVDGGAVLVIPSPLGELDHIAQPHFYAAIASDLPRHRDTLADAICRVWREYASFSAGVAKTRVMLRELCSLEGMTERYLRVYESACRQARIAAVALAEAEAERRAAEREEYAKLTRGLEAAQRWLLERLDPDLLRHRPVSAVPQDWPAEHEDEAAANRAVLARLFAAIDRANGVGLAFCEQASGWAADRAELQERARRAELAQRLFSEQLEALSGMIGEYADLARRLELAQRRLVDRLGPDLLRQWPISAVPDGWPQDHADAAAAHRARLARLLAAVDRADHLGLAFAQQADGWRAQRVALHQALEAAIGERDRQRASPADRGRSTPLVSIVLPVYNQAYLVPEAIAGVVSQTYGNWELIVVDDGSDDGLERCLRYYLGERRVLFVRQPNQRLPAALNHGFAYARGDLLTWTSADNIMLPTQIERLVEELTAHPEAGLVYSDYWAIDDKGAPLADPHWRPHNRDPEIADLIRLPSVVTIDNFHRSGDNFVGASFLYRRPVAEIVGRYVDDAFGGEDYDFWLRMHLATPFRHVAEPLYKYRVHADTLNARAEELGLYANIQEVVEADRWRVATLLTEENLQHGAALLRPVEQFHAVILKRCRPVAYSSLAERDAPAAGDGPLVLDIDVPARMIDPALLRHASILLCRSELAASLLRREEGARGKRVLCWTGELTPAVQHAFVQAFAEQVTTPVTTPAPRVPARIDAPFLPRRILLVVERWASGGLENVVVDLAESLTAGGRVVMVASADGAAPPAAAFADPQIRTVSFGGDQGAFESLIESEAIEVVNYHHSRFAAELAKRQAVATVYTMHNCYLWMDERARQAVAGGLAAMDRLIAVSRQAAQFAAVQFRYPVERIVVIPNGLRDPFIGPATKPAFAGDGAPFTVALVASFTRLKLQHVAIAAFAEAARDIPELRLRLIGATMDPGYGEELRAQIAALPHPDRVELTAGLSRQESVAALAAAQAFLLPSLVEGCSMSLLEAVAAGCVCIASDVGAARDLQIAGGSVLLLPSPLGELDSVTQQQFLDAAASPLPQHRANIAEALRTVWRDYGAFAAGVGDTRARLLQLHGMQQMTDAYLDAYAMARRGGGINGNAARATAGASTLASA